MRLSDQLCHLTILRSRHRKRGNSLYYEKDINLAVTDTIQAIRKEIQSSSNRSQTYVSDALRGRLAHIPKVLKLVIRLYLKM